LRILIDVLHPAHVHFFRHFVAEAHDRGHECLITARDKDMALRLLDAYGLDYRLLTRQRRGVVGLGAELVEHTVLLAREARRFRPHLMMGIMAPCIALAGLSVPARVIAFYDNETARSVNRLVYLLSDAYLAPRGFRTALGGKLIRYTGYHELAYLHPRRFRPDRQLLAQHGIDLRKRLFFVRFVAWVSSHDYGEQGFSLEGKRQLLSILARHGQVLISSEAPLPEDLQPYRCQLPPEMVHHALAFADLFVGESSTMASEACVLGTHSVYVSSTGRGVNDEQAQRYEHAEYFSDSDEESALQRIASLCERADLKAAALSSREKLLEECCDPTSGLSRLLSCSLTKMPCPHEDWHRGVRRLFACPGTDVE
jgi:predicted glycosyltransferase